MLGNDHSEIQAAFTGMLANPIVPNCTCWCTVTPPS